MSEYDYDDGIISGLCSSCSHAEGPYTNDICYVYRMPLYMVLRKKKCKHYKEIDGHWGAE